MKRKKIIILRVLTAVFIAAGIALIAYPAYTNFISSRQISRELSEWEEVKDTSGIEEIGTTAAEPEDMQDEDDPVMDLSQDEYIPAESKLSAEDLFPMKISIPRIELEYMVYEGTDTATLKQGAGHEPVTPLPGEEGRCTISGHRTTYGAPFNRVDELENGDLIYLESLDDRLYAYAVTGIEIVKPTDVWILDGTEKKELLLTACHPKYSAAQRLVVIAELVEIFPFEMET
jgi:sortase A